MMKLYVKEVAEQRGYKTARQLADAMTERFNIRFSYRTLYQYWDDDIARYDKDTLDRLCTFLEVPLSAILVHIPNDRVGLSDSGASEAKAKVTRPPGASKPKRAKSASATAGAVR